MAVATLKPTNAALIDPDVQLMLRVKAGYADAFGALLDRYWDRVQQQLYLMVGSREEAEDLTQEVFLRIFRHRETYLPRAKFATWLFHIVRNMGRNALRDRRRHPVFPMHFPAEHGETPGLEGVLSDRRAEVPSRPLERGEVKQVVRSALDRLTGRHRQALKLHEFEDHTYAEVGARMALSPQAAKSLLYRARHQLRLELTPYMAAT